MKRDNIFSKWASELQQDSVFFGLRAALDSFTSYRNKKSFLVTQKYEYVDVTVQAANF